jgi:imidazole glycerol-phosphate synthase subunit HisF
MLNRRLIPKLQLKVRQVGAVQRAVLVTTVRFSEVIEIGDPVSQAKIYEAQAADELIFLDLDARLQRRETLSSVVEDAAEQVFMPIAVGGGVNTMDDFRRLLAHGADKVAVNTAAVERPGLIDEAAAAFGAQCVVLSIDYRRDPDGTARVFTGNGRVATPLDPVAWAVEGQRRGAGEILLTSIDRDGTGSGLDLDITRRVTASVSIPVITSGGCGLASHFVDGFKDGGADAVSAGTYFCFKDQNPMQTRGHIRNAGIPIRVHH